MARLNVMKTIKEYRNTPKMSTRYGFNSEDMETILKNSKDFYDLFLNAFSFGYAQGVKATRAEIKRNNKTAQPKAD